MKFRQGGFSLIELVVGGGILAGIGLLGMQLIRNQKVSQQKIDHELEIELLHTKISDLFRESAKDCDATFRYHYNLPGPIPAPTQIRRCTTSCSSSTDAQSAVGPVVITAGGTPLGERTLWRVESFGDLISNQVGESASRTNMLLLPVNYVHTTQTGRRLTKFVPIAMRFDSAGRFKQCVDAATTNIQNVEREMCNNLRAVDGSGNYVRGLWNGDTNKCTTTLVHPSGDCPLPAYPAVQGTYIRGIEKGIGTRCVRFRDYADVPPTRALNIFNIQSIRALANPHYDLCNLSIPHAPNSFPRVYSDPLNRVVIKCAP